MTIYAVRRGFVILKKLPKEIRDAMIQNIKAYFYDERDEEIGNLAAEDILQFLVKEIGPYIYNEAVTEARKVLEKGMGSIEDDLYALEKPTQNQKA
jgi:uncharacterized protein (DUF2164 family)